jgi:hypothetical protein
VTPFKPAIYPNKKPDKILNKKLLKDARKIANKVNTIDICSTCKNDSVPIKIKIKFINKNNFTFSVEFKFNIFTNKKLVIKINNVNKN